MTAAVLHRPRLDLSSLLAPTPELDLNPVIVGAPGDGAVVVDALVRAHHKDPRRWQLS